MRLQHGFSLVEVLVTLLVLKVGLLGILAAQTLALRQVQDALQRTQAVALSNAVLAELRSNQSLAGALGTHFNTATELPGMIACRPPQTCSAEHLAAIQLNRLFYQLQQQTGNGLFGAELCLQQDAALQLDISWQQRAHSSAVHGQPCARVAGRSGFVVQSRWR